MCLWEISGWFSSPVLHDKGWPGRRTPLELLPQCSDSSAEPPEAPREKAFITLLFLKLLLQPAAL